MVDWTGSDLAEEFAVECRSEVVLKRELIGVPAPSKCENFHSKP